MKNLGVLVLLFCLVCSFVSAQSQPPMQAGFIFKYDHYNLTDSNSGISVTDDRGNLAVGVFFDAVYLRGVVEYQRAISGTISLTGYAPVDYPSGFSVSFINFQALGKYPFRLGTMFLWPAAGVRYSYPLSMTIGGVDALADPTTDVADFYICFGGGLDFGSSGVIFGISVLYDYSLTPGQTTNPLYPGESVSGYDLEIAMHVGFAL